MNGNKKIRFLSASDRINYGDFLFPLIFKEIITEIDSDITFENYGIIKSDFGHFGALPTKSFRTLEAEMKCGDKIVVGGGEVFFANWATLYGFINPSFRLLLIVKRLRRFERKTKFSNKLLSKKVIPFPFAFDASDFGLEKLKVYYSSVGGGNLLSKNNKLQALAYKRMRSARIISLRDNRSFGYFSAYPDLNAKLIPDSALLMSAIFPKEKLQALIDRELPYNNYIFLQLGLNKGPLNLVEFAKLIDNLATDLKCKILLCPIGLAPGHEDDKILRRIKEIKPHFDYFLPKNIFEIMYLIANSNFYMGTSLHGAITAMSFLIPPIGLNKSVSKLDSYMKTWVSSEFENLEFNKIGFKEVNRLIKLFKTSYIHEKLIEQQALVRTNLETIIND